jgi:hypothetical protein
MGDFGDYEKRHAKIGMEILHDSRALNGMATR